MGVVGAPVIDHRSYIRMDSEALVDLACYIFTALGVKIPVFRVNCLECLCSLVVLLRTFVE